MSNTDIVCLPCINICPRDVRSDDWPADPSIISRDIR